LFPWESFTPADFLFDFGFGARLGRPGAAQRRPRSPQGCLQEAEGCPTRRAQRRPRGWRPLERHKWRKRPQAWCHISWEGPKTSQDPRKRGPIGTQELREKVQRSMGMCRGASASTLLFSRHPFDTRLTRGSQRIDTRRK